MRKPKEPVMSSEIRNAAAGIVVRQDTGDVLLCRRSDRLKFMPGFWVFPGGRIDSAEGHRFVVGASDARQAAAIHAACREIFEESGLLCAEGPLPDRRTIREARLSTMQRVASFDDFLETHGLWIDAEKFVPAGTWITPPLTKIRFHTEYFLYRCSGPQPTELIDGEITDLRWIRPDSARRNWHAGTMKLPHPVAWVLRHLACHRHPDLLAALRQTSVTHAPKFGRMEFRCGISVLPLESRPLPPATHTNCILVGDENLYVIDPGADKEDEFEHLAVQIEHHLIPGGRVAGILLTHSHRDHVGAARFVRERFDAPLAAHRDTQRQLDFDVDELLEDGQVIEVSGNPGWRLKCLHTPGHDPGHMCFLEECTRTLLAGDMVTQTGSVIIAPKLEGSMQNYLDSLRRLLNEDIRLIIPAHGLLLERPQQRLQEILDHRLARERRIAKALRQGARTLDDLISQAYDDVDASLRPLAEQTLLAHLEKLGYPVHNDVVQV